MADAVRVDPGKSRCTGLNAGCDSASTQHHADGARAKTRNVSSALRFLIHPARHVAPPLHSTEERGFRLEKKPRERDLMRAARLGCGGELPHLGGQFEQGAVGGFWHACDAPLGALAQEGSGRFGTPLAFVTANQPALFVPD